MGERKGKTVDITPRWSGLVPILLNLIENGPDKARKEAKEHIIDLAKSVDANNAKVREGEFFSKEEIRRLAEDYYATLNDDCDRNKLADMMTPKERAEAEIDNFLALLFASKKERYDVKGDHPTLARPDKFDLPKVTAERYAKELREQGYENVTVTPVSREEE